MLSVYRKLKPLEQENPRKFRNQLNTYDFSDIYPIMDTYLPYVPYLPLKKKKTNRCSNYLQRLIRPGFTPPVNSAK